jgi:hypothetical protein
MTTKFNYLLTASNLKEQNLSLDIDFLQGLYSAQLLIDAEQKTNSVNLISEIGQIQTSSSYGYTLTRIDKISDEVKTAVVEEKYDPSTSEVRFRFLPYIEPDEVPSAYNKALNNPLSFSTIGLDIIGKEYDVTKTPFHVIGNFETPSSERLLDFMFSQHIYKEAGSPEIEKARFDTVFSITSDNDLATYYIGTTSDARNTFMVKVICQNISMFLQGFFAFFKWLVETDIANSSRMTKFGRKYQLIPVFYLYDYGRNIALRNTSDKVSMESQLPIKITTLEIKH